MRFTLLRTGEAWLVGATVLMALMFAGKPSFADQSKDEVEELSEQVEAASNALGNRRFFIMPIPVSNPTLGTGLGAMTMRLFHAGENAPPSSFMVGGLWANSKSWLGGGGVKIHTKDDNWRISGWLGYFDVNLKFFGTGNEAGDQGRSINIEQWGPFFSPRVLRRMTGDFYLGIQYRLMTVTTAFPDLPDWIPGDVLRDGIKITSSGLGLVAEYDTKSNSFNPVKGSFLEFGTVFSRKSLGSDRDYELYDVAFNLYTELAEEKILAWRVTGCFTGGDTPFYDLCMVGGAGDKIRGYVGGQYRDEVSFSTQLEYRWKFHKKLGMVAFGGFGQIAPSFGDMTTENLLPSYGVGIRYRVSDAQRINLGVDYARGKDSDAWYFRIAEAF